MTTQKQTLVAQIVVAIIVGTLSSVATGSMTAYVLTNKFDKKLETHIIEAKSNEAQIRRDIARIEQSNVMRDRDSSKREETINQIKTDVAVIRQIIETR